jgi:predicted SprT family Zn-dependent metalloprotease
MNEHGIPCWTFRFDRAKRRFGVCKHRPEVIGLSVYLTRMNDEAQVRDVILHEIAHAIAGHKAGHGPKWKRVCLRIGAKPRRCYVSAEVNQPKKNWVAICPEHGPVLERLRVARRTRDQSSCPLHPGDYNERFKLTWRRI